MSETNAAVLPPEEERADRLALALAVAVTGAFAAVLACRKIYSGDIWMHLATARLMVETRTVPMYDCFLYNSQGARWVNHSWLAQLFFYGAVRLLGVGVLVWLKISFAVLAGGLFCLLCAARGARPLASCAFSCLAVCVAVPHFICRPLLFGIAFLPLILLLLARPTRARLCFALAVQLLWANTHASFPLGIGLFFVTALSHTAARRGWLDRLGCAFPAGKDGRAASLAALWGAFALAFAVSLLNPNGLDAFTYGVALRKLGWVGEYISEWQPFNVHDIFQQRLIGMLGCAVLLQILCIFTTCRLVALPELLVFCAVFALSIDAMRFIREAGFMAAVVGAVSLSALCSKERFCELLLALAALFVAAWFLFATVKYDNTLHRRGFGLDTDVLPVAAVEFMKEHGISGDIACDMYAGGYIEWNMPGSRPSADGRLEANNQEYLRHLRSLSDSGPEWRKAFPLPGESDVFLMRNVGSSNRYDTVLQEWRVVYWNENWVLWLRRDGKYRDLVRQGDVSFASPPVLEHTYPLLPPERKAQVELLLIEHLRTDPQCTLAVALLGYADYVKAMDKLGEWYSLSRSLAEAKAKGDAQAAGDFAARGTAARAQAVELLRQSSQFYVYDLDSRPNKPHTWYALARNKAWFGDYARARECLLNSAGDDPLNLLYPVFEGGGFAIDAPDFYEVMLGRDSAIAMDGREFRDWVMSQARGERKRIVADMRKRGREKDLPAWLLR